jgi:DNA primase
MSNEVENLLREKQIYFRVSGNDYLTKCFNPDHEDSNPSFRIDKVKGIGHCFSCGFKFNIFKHYGLITNTVNIKVAGLKEKLKELKVSSDGMDMLDGYTPITTKFRGISVKTLEKFGAFYTDKVKDMEDRLIVPLKDIRGKIRVFLGRHMLSNGNPRYMNYPKDAKLPLFPPMLEVRAHSLVLVEGLFDMLNLYDKGLHNVVSTMGTNTLNNDGAKHRLLPFKAQGVVKIFICYDGDTAGRDASQDLKPRLESIGFQVEIIEMEDNTDPGEFSQEEVDNLKDYIK